MPSLSWQLNPPAKLATSEPQRKQATGQPTIWERRNTHNSMNPRKLLLLALGAGIADAFQDTSPFVLLSTSE